jgi:hypothetical protein
MHRCRISNLFVACVNVGWLTNVTGLCACVRKGARRVRDFDAESRITLLYQRRRHSCLRPVAVLPFAFANARQLRGSIPIYGSAASQIQTRSSHRVTLCRRFVGS